MSALPSFAGDLDEVALSALQSARPISVLVCALGGEGGGVLTEWLVEAAIRAGYPVQSTSIPGVAQRTGATTYYIEIFPVKSKELEGRQPILSLYPVPGCLDVIVSSELLETVRQVSLGMSSAERTHIISSDSRTLTTSERMHQADGRLDSEQLENVVRAHSLKQRVFDMDRVAKRNQTVVSAVMFGALVGSGVLPFQRDVCEDVIRLDGKNAERSLAGFNEALLLVGNGPNMTASADQSASAESSADVALEAFPVELRGMVSLAIKRLVDYQDRRYADLYLQRLQLIVAAERAVDPTGRHQFAAALEMSRYLALWMAFDDIVRVADLKARRSRALRVEKEVKAKVGELVRVYDFFKPGIPEFAALLPERLALRLQGVDQRRKRRGQEPLSFPLKISSTSVTGLLTLRTLASLRWLRRRGSRFAEEQRLIDRWLGAVRIGLALDWQLGFELALCGRLIKGYGSTNERGKENLLHVIDHLAPHAPIVHDQIAARAAAIRSVRDAALADDAGIAFDQALVERGAAPRALKEQPVRFMRRPVDREALVVKEASRR